ncbi:MAG: hypothetical protein ACUVRL_06685 [Candidatus Saccharicenans sp.]|uniref:hypothetical protein n=1 Tax=Candidatus Saccharicenans sp. TaxID=2819258 RepID=UPI00404ACED6
MATEVIPGSGSAGAGQKGGLQRDQCLLNFLKILRLTFKMASIYNKDHPTFKRTVEELMASLESVLQFSNPLVMGFSPHSLLIGEQFLSGGKTTTELAQLFHLRKIKRLEIHSGLSIQELLSFISGLTRPIPEFIRQGGVKALFGLENFAHLKLEILDYSQLLQGEGEEIKEIWPYLLMEAVTENDSNKLDLLAGSFEKVVGRLNTEELVQNEELHKNLIQFFLHLRETGRDKFSRCARELLRSLLAVRKLPAESRLEKLRQIISSLSEKELASTLWEEIISNDRLDSMSFAVFTRLIHRERHETISTTLREMFTGNEPRNRRAEVEKKIRSLLNGNSGQLLTDIYRQTLASLLNEISFEKQIAFDHKQLGRNYRFILINLLSIEKKKEAASQFLERILEEWPSITEEKDLEFIQSLLTVLREKANLLVGEPGYEKACQSIYSYLEDCVLQGDDQPELDALLLKLPGSIHKPDVYLSRIFIDRLVTTTILRAFFRFFEESLPSFLDFLSRRAADSWMLEKIAIALGTIDLPVSLTILKKIYLLGDQNVKLQVLRAMQPLSEFDENFLFPILNSRNRQLKAEALSLLMRYERTRHVAFIRLLNLTSPYGIRNRRLIQHLQIVDEKNLREARPFLLKLAARKDFWNRRVRQEARRILEKWNGWDEG